MDDDTFWSLVALFAWKKLGNDEAVMRPAARQLEKLGAPAAAGFQELLAQKLFALDTREHARACYLGELDPDDGDDYISADDFLNSGRVGVANGKAFYDGVLADPTTFPKDVEFESLLYLAAEVHEELTGDEVPEPSVSWESFTNTVGWAPTAATRPGTATGENVPPMNRRPT